MLRDPKSFSVLLAKFDKISEDILKVSDGTPFLNDTKTLIENLGGFICDLNEQAKSMAASPTDSDINKTKEEMGKLTVEFNRIRDGINHIMKATLGPTVLPFQKKSMSSNGSSGINSTLLESSRMKINAAESRLRDLENRQDQKMKQLQETGKGLSEILGKLASSHMKEMKLDDIKQLLQDG